MAARPALTTKEALARIAKALVEFAKEQGWTPDQYQVLFRVLEDWGRISVMLVADDFKGLSNREMWDKVFDSLEAKLKPGGDIGFSLGLSVREKRQVEQGGMYTIPEGYVDAADLLPASSLNG
jgi:hypothetical protein